MKVAIVAHNIVKRGDGQGKANYEFVRHSLAKGHEIHLYANKIEPELREKTNFHLIRAVRRPAILKSPMFLIIATIKLFYRKYDIIYTDSCNYLGHRDFSCAHFCHKRYLQYKMRLYDRIFESFNSWVERFEYKRKSTIIAVSEHLKCELMEDLHIPSDRIKVVHNGVDPLEFQISNFKCRGLQLNAPTRPTTFLFIGDCSYGKGLDFLIEAMRGVDKNIRLLIAGKPKKKYKKLAKGLNVEFLGFRTDIHELFQEVDGFILPSIYDTFAIVVLEAMASGVPTIVSGRAGVSELIQDMENGIIIKDPTNIDEIREKIKLLASNPELRKKMSEQALNTAQNYSWEKMAKEKWRLIDESFK